MLLPGGRAGQVQLHVDPTSCLRTCTAMSGTHMPYGATSDNVRGSWMAVDLKRYRLPLPFYALPTKRPVLMSAFSATRHRLEVEAYSLRSDACQVAF
eukprot:7556-Rhodomonas_salina.2